MPNAAAPARVAVKSRREIVLMGGNDMRFFRATEGVARMPRGRRRRLSFEGGPQQRNRARRLRRQVFRRGFNADAAVVGDGAKVGEEGRVIVFVPRQRKDPALWVGHVQVADVL